MSFSKFYFVETFEIQNADLKKYYNDFNTKYFDGELPDIPMGFVNSRTAGGWVSASLNTRTRVITIKKLVISKYFKRDEENFIQIMLHEMIHVWMHHNNKMERDHHGLMFKEKKREIEKLSGIKIPISDSIKSVVSDDVKSKMFDVVFIDKGADKYSVGVFKHGFFKKFLDDEGVDFNALKRVYTRPIFIVQSDDRTLLQFPTQRSRKKISYYSIDDEDADRILKTGKTIYK